MTDNSGHGEAGSQNTRAAQRRASLGGEPARLMAHIRILMQTDGQTGGWTVIGAYKS